MTAWQPTYLDGMHAGVFAGYIRDHGDIRLAVMSDDIGWYWSIARAGRVLADGRQEHGFLGCEAADLALEDVLIGDRKVGR